MRYLFKLYYDFYWRGAFIWAFLWSGLFYHFLSPYPISLAWWLVPATIPLAITSIFRSILFLYYLVMHHRFFNNPRVMQFLATHPEFTLSEFSRATRKPQVIAYYFLIHSPHITTVHEDSCNFKVVQQYN